jgi:integrase
MAASSQNPQQRASRSSRRNCPCVGHQLRQLRTEDLDPAHRTVRVRAETTKNRSERVVPHTAATGVLLSSYLAHRERTKPGTLAVDLVGVSA